ncbi:MAG: dihydropteroate synthase, partial [Terriglobales bacterium]
SRKSFVGKTLGDVPPEARLAGTLAATTAAVLAGAHVVRAHDVAATRDALRIADAIRASAVERGA